MAYTKTRCPKCNKIAESVKQYEIGTKTVHLLKCNHILSHEHLAASGANFTSLDGAVPYPFQQDGIKFIEESGGRCLIADEMGLGKTIQALGAIALHEEMQPVAYFVKAGLKTQWQHQIMRWVSTDDDDGLALAQVIDGPKDQILPGIKHYIFSFDILRRFKKGQLEEWFAKRGIKTVVIDECQAIKNSESARTERVRALSKLVDNVIALSGTPIKNNAGEYFPILNIINPVMFPTLSRFLYNDCQSYNNGWATKVGGLRYPDQFKRKTEKFIIRRERKEVLPDLPPLRRDFHFDQLGEDVEEAYKTQFLMFRDEYNSQGDKGAFNETTNALAYLSRMRHLVGISKIDPCVEFIEEFLDSTDRKIVIFLHHKDVGELLARRLRHVLKDRYDLLNEQQGEVLQLTAELDSLERDRIISDFQKPGNRILIASTLASGEGLNLQFCSDCVILERQWNPSNEEQAEARFLRIGQLAQSVVSTYFVAVGTVDEFFSRLVEEKREIVTKTLGGEAVKWDQSSLMKELASILASQGGKQWNL